MMAETGYGCVTALYDCRSKQEYIYRTNRIREISGGSELLANVYGMFFRAAEKKGLRINSDWRSGAEFSVKAFAESNFDGEVIYEGGGNLCIIYKNRETYIRANRIFSRMLLEKTYTISIIASCVDTTDNFKEDRKRLYKENSRIKSTDWISVPCNTLPITQVDRDTFMPIVKKEDNCSLSRESVLKRKAFEKSAEVGEMFLDDISGEENKGTESLLAVIYVDGNAMGKKVKACTENISGYTECTSALRRFSISTDKSFVERPISAIKAKLAERTDGRHKFRRVIAGGDEITLICNARAALDVVTAYFSALDEENRSLPDDQKNYACAGIAIAHSHAPFSDVYEIAEQCCESGKKKSRAQDSRVNYVDFHFCRSGITNDMETIRETQENGLTARPYEVSAELSEFISAGQRLSAIGRANIKDLATAMIKGDSCYRFEVERIKSRYPAAGLDSGDEKLRKLIFDIAQVYDIWFAKPESDEQEASE